MVKVHVVEIRDDEADDDDTDTSRTLRRSRSKKASSVSSAASTASTTASRTASTTSTASINAKHATNRVLRPLSNAGDTVASGVRLGADTGWVRVWTGAPAEDPTRGTLVYLTSDTAVRHVARDLLLAPHLTLWLQYGGGEPRRLRPSERPLQLQDAFLTRLGYTNPMRRARVGIDPGLRHLVRVTVGPAAPTSAPAAVGALRSGTPLLLKGMVFPQWRRRPVLLLADRVFIYPGDSSKPSSVAGTPEVLCLGGGCGSVCRRAPRGGRLVMRVTARPISGDEDAEVPLGERHLFLGFTEPCERDMWAQWLTKAVSLPASGSLLDLSGAGLTAIPTAILSWSSVVEDLLLRRNSLGESIGAAEAFSDDASDPAALALLARLPLLKALQIQANQLRTFPPQLLQLRKLVRLDLADNRLATLPDAISQLTSLEELRTDRNELTSLPGGLANLSRLRLLSAAGNSLAALPHFLLHMRALAFLDVHGNRVTAGGLPSLFAARDRCAGDGGNSPNDVIEVIQDESDEEAPLGRVDLRANLLKGTIILADYGNLTQLDVSENHIERLDLSALDKLRAVQCSRNCLRELALSGSSLASLIAGNNQLETLTVSPAPTLLEHLDVSYNRLQELPDWIGSCGRLRALFASHNQLTTLPAQLLSAAQLQLVQLSYNRLTQLPSAARCTQSGHLELRELFLQSNRLSSLPPGFLTAACRLRVLNLSNNALRDLWTPVNGAEVLPTKGPDSPKLEKLYVTANHLGDEAFVPLAAFRRLRTLHAAYNALRHLSDSTVASWPDLEELVISGNELSRVPDAVATLRHLRVLRVHSNWLIEAPSLSRMPALRVLDLAHNRLCRVDLAALVPPQLRFLDLAGNPDLHVDARQFQAYQSRRPLSLVDVSGRNRSSLPQHPTQQPTPNTSQTNAAWNVGFAETPGHREKLYVSQLRLPFFCRAEGLFGLFDGGAQSAAPEALARAVPRLVLEERAVQETAADYLKYTLLAAHRELREQGQRCGLCATIVHVTQRRKRVTLRVASVGEARAVLGRAGGVLPLTRDAASGIRPPPELAARSQLGCSALFPLVLPDPHVVEVELTDGDDIMVLANKRLWEVMSGEEAIKEARTTTSPLLAAKRLQDIAQSYGCEDNVSVMVIRWGGAAETDPFINELRNTMTIRRESRGVNHAPAQLHLPVPTVEQVPCCCGADRSSPSGQSDQASGESNTLLRAVRRPVDSDRSGSRSGSGSHSESSGSERSRLSEEQLRCWEYMLEQNTQLLFDKELDTLSRVFSRPVRRPPSASSTLRLSASSPHLAGPSSSIGSAGAPTMAAPFLSRHFGSARSLASPRRLLHAGPNAAYFGSLQRLMSYNVEYDFDVIHERDDPESLERDGRMRKYWDVATTEL